MAFLSKSILHLVSMETVSSAGRQRGDRKRGKKWQKSFFVLAEVLGANSQRMIQRASHTHTHTLPTLLCKSTRVLTAVCVFD